MEAVGKKKGAVPLVQFSPEGVPLWKRVNEDVWVEEPELEWIYMAGVPKKMPRVGANPDDNSSGKQGIQKYRNGNTPMNNVLKAPFPWPGGKADIAGDVWSRFGVTDNYVEPFAGSAAMLLARPGGAHGTETVNDLDGLLINAYRGITLYPDEVAEWCDWPVSESDLTSRHLWLKGRREELTQRLFGDPLYCDPQAAGWWLWGIASWIGDGWCVSDGPWISVDGRLVDRRKEGAFDAVPPRQMPGMTPNAVTGIETYRASVPKKIPHVGRGANSESKNTSYGVQAVRYQEGVRRKMPMVSGGHYSDSQGVQSYAEPSALFQYFTRLSDRLRRVRFLCGNWERAVKDSVTVNHGLTAVFIDSPYPKADHSMAYHSDGKGEEDVWFQSARWAVERGDDKRLRIAVCGYMSPECDAIFPPTWERLSWEARGGYANQSKDGRGRANAKRETVWFSPHCIDAKTDYGPLFAGIEDIE